VEGRKTGPLGGRSKVEPKGLTKMGSRKEKDSFPAEESKSKLKKKKQKAGLIDGKGLKKSQVIPSVQESQEENDKFQNVFRAKTKGSRNN